MQDFYDDVIHRLLSRKTLTEDSRVLVLCGGNRDKETLQRFHFRNVVISNIDPRMQGNEYLPYQWSFQDAENLTFEDESFDFAFVHSGLHHCYSPHRALLEMYRVTRKGFVLFEPYDNIVSRLGVSLNFGQEFEHAAVFYNDCIYGGVRNSEIPNYVYRWTEREIVKTINTSAPYAEHRFEFIYKMRVPWEQLKARKNKIFYLVAALSHPLLKLIEYLIPKQCNNFAAVVLKPEIPTDLHPWLEWNGRSIAVNRVWMESRYKKT